MGKSPLILAALAADAVPRLGFQRLGQLHRVGNLLRQELLGNDNRDYEVLYPATPAGKSELASEVNVLTLLKGAQFDFEIPMLLGQTLDQDQNPAAVVSRVLGEFPQPHKLVPGPFTESFASALAQIHSLPTSYFSDAGLPEFDAATILHSRVAELDQMASTGRVPAALLGRWENAMEDVTLFRFHPTVIHGSISDAAIRVSGPREGSRLLGLTDWSGLRIADPAEDFWWIAGGAILETAQDLTTRYQAIRQPADVNILRRGMLYSELQLGRWLLYCIEQKDEGEIARAEDGLSELREELENGNLLELSASQSHRVSAAGAKAISDTWLNDAPNTGTNLGIIAEAAVTVLADSQTQSGPSDQERGFKRQKPKRDNPPQDSVDLEELF